MQLLDVLRTLKEESDGPRTRRSAPQTGAGNTKTDVYGYKLEEAVLGEYGHDDFVPGLGIIVKEG